MIYSKKNISKFGNETGYINNNIEKVIRLIDVLNYLFSRSTFKDKLILKGGTAINLIHTNLKRLSVDIDLDYCGSLDKETVLKDRERLEKELDKYMVEEEYEISQKSRSSFALFSRTYRYKNAFGSDDAIKVDINFMDRVHLYPAITTTVIYFDKTVTIKTPSIDELFGMKINALLDRSKPRDLYDCIFLVDNLKLFDRNLLRKAVVFYLSLNGVYLLNDSSFDSIRDMSYRSVRLELQPVLRKGEFLELEEAKKVIIDTLKKLLVLTNKEKQYLLEFSKGNYDPSLLFDEITSSRIINHPMARWRIANITK